MVKESVGRTYADSEEEAELDDLFGVVWVARCFEIVLMFARGLSMEICFDVVVDEMNLDIWERECLVLIIGILMREFDARVNRVRVTYEGF